MLPAERLTLENMTVISQWLRRKRPKSEPHLDQPALRASTAFVWAMAFSALALTAVATTGHLVPGDQWAARAIQSFPNAGFLEEPADLLAYPPFEFLVWLAGTALAWRAGRTDLLIAAVIVALALGANPLIKELVERGRPASSQVTVREAASGYGFPSGHTDAATLIYGFLAYSYFLTVAPARWLAAMALGSAVLLVGLDRAYTRRALAVGCRRRVRVRGCVARHLRDGGSPCR